MKRSFATLFAIAALGLAACGDDGGGSGGGGNDYPQQAEDNFLEACTSQPQATEAYCQCTYDEITANVTYEEFQEAEKQIGTGGDIGDAPPETREAFQNAVEKCRDKAGG